MKKAEVSIQTFFLIFMSILMVGIVIFGFQKIFLVEDQISEQKRIQIRNDLRVAVEACEDPLSQGNIKTIKIRHKEINGVCVVNKDINNVAEFDNLDDIKQIQETEGSAVILLKTIFDEKNDVLLNYQIIDSFQLDFDPQISFCKYDKKNKGSIDFSVKC